MVEPAMARARAKRSSVLHEPPTPDPSPPLATPAGEGNPEAVPQSPPLPERLRVLLRLEADEELAADVEHRAFDHRGLSGHERERLLPAQGLLILRRQRA